MRARWLRRAAPFIATALIALGLLLRYAGLHFLSGDMEAFVLPWYEHLAAGGFSVLREPFYNYTPPYLYLLYLATLTHGLLPSLTAIKLISILFDLGSAFVIYKLLKIRYPEGPGALLGAAGFMLLPTVLVNSAVWGQADATYTFFLLASVYALIKDRPLAGMILLGLSFSFKAQAVFLGPFILLLVIRGKIPWYYLAIVPAVYAIMMIPAAIAGRPIMDLLKVYLSQSEDYRSLSMHAPNLYVFASNKGYAQGLVGGLAVTIELIVGWIVLYLGRLKRFTPSLLLLSALVSVALVPFSLPKMHDRYFYPADVLSYVTVFFQPALWYVAAGYQVISGLVYYLFLKSAAPELSAAVVRVAAVLNTALIAGLALQQYRMTVSAPALEENGSRI